MQMPPPRRKQLLRKPLGGTDPTERIRAGARREVVNIADNVNVVMFQRPTQDREFATVKALQLSTRIAPLITPIGNSILQEKLLLLIHSCRECKISNTGTEHLSSNRRASTTAKD